MHQALLSQQQSPIWKGMRFLAFANGSSTYFQDQKGIHISMIVSNFLTHVSTPRLEICTRNVSGLFTVLICMKLSIPLMAMLRSLKLLAEMQFGMQNEVHPPHTSSVQHCKTPPTILVPRGLFQSQLPLVFLPLLILVFLLNYQVHPSSFISFGYVQMI